MHRPDEPSRFSISDFFYQTSELYFSPEWQEDPRAFVQLRSLVEVLNIAKETHSKRFFWLTDQEEELLAYMTAAVATSKFATERFQSNNGSNTTT